MAGAGSKQKSGQSNGARKTIDELGKEARRGMSFREAAHLIKDRLREHLPSAAKDVSFTAIKSMFLKDEANNVLMAGEEKLKKQPAHNTAEKLQAHGNSLKKHVEDLRNGLDNISNALKSGFTSTFGRRKEELDKNIAQAEKRLADIHNEEKRTKKTLKEAKAQAKRTGTAEALDRGEMTWDEAMQQKKEMDNKLGVVPGQTSDDWISGKKPLTPLASATSAPVVLSARAFGAAAAGAVLADAFADLSKKPEFMARLRQTVAAYGQQETNRAVNLIEEQRVNLLKVVKHTQHNLGRVPSVETEAKAKELGDVAELLNPNSEKALVYREAALAGLAQKYLVPALNKVTTDLRNDEYIGFMDRSLLAAQELADDYRRRLRPGWQGTHGRGTKNAINGLALLNNALNPLEKEQTKSSHVSMLGIDAIHGWRSQDRMVRNVRNRLDGFEVDAEGNSLGREEKEMGLGAFAKLLVAGEDAVKLYSAIRTEMKGDEAKGIEAKTATEVIRELQDGTLIEKVMREAHDGNVNLSLQSAQQLGSELKRNDPEFKEKVKEMNFLYVGSILAINRSGYMTEEQALLIRNVEKATRQRAEEFGSGLNSADINTLKSAVDLTSPSVPSILHTRLGWDDDQWNRFLLLDAHAQQLSLGRTQKEKELAEKFFQDANAVIWMNETP